MSTKASTIAFQCATLVRSGWYDSDSWQFPIGYIDSCTSDPDVVREIQAYYSLFDPPTFKLNREELASFFELVGYSLRDEGK